MSETSDPKAALERLTAAVSRLEAKIGEKHDALRDQGDMEDEIQRLNNDRSKLADALDKEKAKAEKLADANADVSRRLVAAMENIRGVLERGEG